MSLTIVFSTEASQADVAVYKAFQKQYPQFARWFNHIASFTEEFGSLPGDASASAESYGPQSAKAPAAAEEEDDDDDVDLFGSDDDEVDEAAEELKRKRLAEYAAKKAAKPKTAAKTMVTIDVKPWDDETDLEELLANVKKIEKDGLVWGAHQWIPVGFGIKKLQINCVVEDDKVSVDDLQQEIESDEDHVQSTDVAAMAKL